MFTVKLFRGEHAETPHSCKMIQAHSVDVRAKIDPVTGLRPGKHLVTDDGLSTEWHYYLGDETSEQYDWAVIENAAGKTTEVVRP